MVIMTKDHGGQLRPLDLKCISSIHTWNKVVWKCHNEQKHQSCCSQRWYDGVAMSETVNAKWVRDALVWKAISEQQPTLAAHSKVSSMVWSLADLFSSESVVTTGFNCVDLSAIQSSGKQQPYSKKHAMLFVLKTQAMLPCCAFICDWQLEEWFWQWHACHKQVVSIHRINLHYIDLNTVLPTAKPHHVYYLYRLGPTP